MSTYEVGKRLRALRTRMGLTAKALGKRAGMSQVAISRLECGVRGFRTATLMTLAKALDVPAVYFFIDDLSVLSVRVAGELEKHGVTPSKRLLSALIDPAFLRFAEKAARLFGGKQKRLVEIDEALAGVPWRRITLPLGRPRKHK